MKQLAAITILLCWTSFAIAQDKPEDKKKKTNKPTTMLIPKLDTTYLKRNNFVSDSLSAINKASLDSLYAYNLVHSESVQATTGSVAFIDMGMPPKNMLLYAFCNIGMLIGRLITPRLSINFSQIMFAFLSFGVAIGLCIKGLMS